MVYFAGAARSRRNGVSWIFVTMLGMILGSIVIERILPQAAKDRLGAVICWSMMAITMTFLVLSTVGLVVSTWVRYIQPALSG
jgi:hypothetical protein